MNVWRTPLNSVDTNCLRVTVKHGGGSFMMWVTISWFSASRILTLERRVTGTDSMDILANQTHPMIQTLFSSGGVDFQDYKCPIHAAIPVKAWFKEHEDEVAHFCLPS
ncbi:hypothetical protein AVEN_87679-1 [Araneus ventricosus]|uniref:Uncharacterized protein n=1 Tax=Araneus ventricosus TaxID=182803 RepID=A0A4Y2CZC4_ARAVE|nr:hypothetical protein AVEN_87679-1 [Araneus ventricosus]